MTIDMLSPMGDNCPVTYEVRQTEVFSKWLRKLRSLQGKAAIAARITRFQLGLFGDVKSVGGGVMEMRVHVGPGYRVYYTERDGDIVILMNGGDKSSQKADIEKAKEIAKEV